VTYNGHPGSPACAQPQIGPGKGTRFELPPIMRVSVCWGNRASSRRRMVGSGLAGGCRAAGVIGIVTIEQPEHVLNPVWDPSIGPVFFIAAGAVSRAVAAVVSTSGWGVLGRAVGVARNGLPSEHNRLLHGTRGTGSLRARRWTQGICDCRSVGNKFQPCGDPLLGRRR